MTITVGLVEDSPVAAAEIRQVVEATRAFSVKWWSALQDVDYSVPPNAWILDLLMPGRSGLSAVAELCVHAPVVILSDADPDSRMVTEALARGAAAFVTKRSLGDAAGHERLRHTLHRVAASVAVPRHREPTVVVIVGSTGAVGPLELLMRGARRDLAYVVLIHLPEDRIEDFAVWLTSLGLPARVAQNGDRPVAGQVLVAPGGVHLHFTGAGRLRCADAPPVDGHRPSASELLSSAATLGRRLVAVVLSGLGADGASAIPKLIASGATCLVQDPSDASAPSMPRHALASSPKAQRIPMSKLSERIQREA